MLYKDENFLFRSKNWICRPANYIYWPCSNRLFFRSANLILISFLYDQCQERKGLHHIADSRDPDLPPHSTSDRSLNLLRCLSVHVKSGVWDLPPPLLLNRLRGNMFNLCKQFRFGHSQSKLASHLRSKLLVTLIILANNGVLCLKFWETKTA